MKQKQRMIIGRYIHRDSSIHMLDPRAKTVSMLLFMLGVFLCKSYAEVLVLLLFTLTMILCTRIPLGIYIRAVKPLLFLILFIILFHALFDQEGAGTRLVDTGAFALYSGGLKKGLIAAARMTLFIMFTAILTFTTQPDRLAQGLGSLLRPLQGIGVPVNRMMLMLSVALRFIPAIFEEAERIWKAQISRGLELKEKPMKEKARLLIAMLVPVTAGAFRRAVQLADSMEARGYQLNGERTAYRTLHWRPADTLYILTFLLPAAAMIVL